MTLVIARRDCYHTLYDSNDELTKKSRRSRIWNSGEWRANVEPFVG